MIDDLQELCLKAGLVATRTNPHQFLTVSYTRGEVVPRGENNFSEEKYSGMVYCVSVPNRIILVRRNGKMAWCGNCYGPRQFPEKLIPFFTLRALHGLFLPIYGDGQYSRDYTYVMDFCEACDLAMRVKPRGEAINIATGRDVKVIDIARMILGHLGKPEALIRHVKDRPGHVRRLVGDYTRAKEIMGWRPRTSFEEGLRKTIDWYINNEWWWRPLSSQFMKVALPWERPRPRR
ncbi:TPA: NAD-dependent epimerase/dehydratase family protein [Candidatus Bathyarchaeota archaeon]|nr:NAD-dependent epimerase/dehydratase family protein [Candidatus Bathyarchaeota archaeon]